jgi:hypothetical protein
MPGDCRRTSSRVRRAGTRPRTCAIGDDGGQRHDPATERLAEDVHVGDDALVLACERRAGPPETRLDLVGHQQDAALGAELAGRTEVPLGRHDHAGLALDRLDEERDRVVVDRGAQRFDIPYGTDPNPGVNGPKPPFAEGSSENPTIVTVRPWKFPSATTIFARSGRPPSRRSPTSARS